MSIAVEKSLADREPVVTDGRLELVAEKLRSRYGHRKLEDVTFVTWIEPAQTVRKDGNLIPVEDRAVFAALSPNPRAHLYPAGAPDVIASTGTAWLKDFRSAIKEWEHYANRPDPLFEIYKAVVPAHLRTIQNLKELI